MGRRRRQHINPLKESSLVPRAPLALPAQVPVEVELGCGDGIFLVKRAQAQPERLFVGLDIRPEFLEPGQRQVRHLGLTNVRLETCNLIVDTSHLFPQQRVSVFWVNFPDPWFKRRQQNRRWLNQMSVQHLVDALEPGGALVYQSDVWDPTIEAMGLLESHPRLTNTMGEFTFSRERFASQQTSREVACEAEGRRIWRVRFQRLPAEPNGAGGVDGE